MSPSRTRQTRAQRRAAPEAAAAELLIEIGTEELPAHFIPPALHALAESMERALHEHRLDHGPIRTYGTPRRLTTVVESLASRQTPVSRETMGPPRAIAFDANGDPTKAAIKFAESQGVAVADLQVRQTPKGEYVFAAKHDPGRHTPVVLAEILPPLIKGLSFPRSMKWDDSGLRFGRPVRWLLAVYDGKSIPIVVAGIRSGDRSMGHRFLAPDWRRGFRVSNFKLYENELARCGVIVDQDRRREMIITQLERLAKKAGGHLHRDEALLEQAIYTVEYPRAILGEFNPRYLALPKDVLITAMKEHQGYFSLVKKDGSLLPGFIAVTNMKLPNMGLIREGNERVLAARLADAKFFFDEDRKIKLVDRVNRLSQVVFHQKLGTLYQKMERMRDLASHLAATLGLSRESVAACRRAAELAKADLLTGMVREFPTLQGIVGGEYAAHDGESDMVSRAVAEQYLPPSMDGPLPKTVAGKVLSLADRLDTITAFFHVGLIPTGSEDPYALRRHGAAIVRLVIEGELPLKLGEALAEARALVLRQGFAASAGGAGAKGAPSDPLDFIAERLRHYGRTAYGLREDVMEAVLAPADRASYDLVDLLSRMKAVQAITTRAEFEPLMVGFKRAHRLVEKEQWARTEVDPNRFLHPSEHELKKALDEAGQLVPSLLAKRDYAQALDVLVRLKPAIDSFFLGVLVNAEDPALRANRLSLLSEVDRLFMSFADFSQVAVQG